MLISENEVQVSTYLCYSLNLYSVVWVSSFLLLYVITFCHFTFWPSSARNFGTKHFIQFKGVVSWLLGCFLKLYVSSLFCLIITGGQLVWLWIFPIQIVELHKFQLNNHTCWWIESFSILWTDFAQIIYYRYEMTLNW